MPNRNDISPDLASLFAQLAAPTDPVVFSAAPITGWDRHRIARDYAGHPVLLINSSGDSGSPPPTTVLENLAVQYDVLCEIETVTGQDRARFTLISCNAADLAVRDYFLRVAGTLIVAIGPGPSHSAVAHGVNAVIRLFRALAQPARQTVQGLWAELFLIERSRNPILLAQAWHATPDELFDFTFGRERLDVKSTTGGLRQHYFAVGQLQPPPGANAIIGSMYVERASGGQSLADLLDSVRRRLGPSAELALKVEATLASTLGSTMSRAMNEGFDRELARSSLRFYAVEDIPSIILPVPSGVSDVRFRSDLSRCTPLALDAAEGLLFRAALPVR